MTTYKKQPFGCGAVLNPVPAVIVTCGSSEAPNALTIAWAGTACTKPPMVSISIRPERYSYGLIKESGEFVINLTTAELTKATDYLGVRSGRDENKLEKMGLSVEPAQKVSAPVLCESPLSIECKVEKIIPLGSHDMFLASIVAVSVAPELLDKSGRLCLEKAGLISYCHGQYFELGKCLGSFGYSVKKNTKKKKSKTK